MLIMMMINNNNNNSQSWGFPATTTIINNVNEKQNQNKYFWQSFDLTTRMMETRKTIAR